MTYCTKTVDSASAVCPVDGKLIELDEEEAGSTPNWLDVVDPDLVLTDTYSMDVEYQHAITEQVEHAVVADDAQVTLCADFVINGNVYAEGLEYDWIDHEPVWCLGTQYLAIRSEICERRTATGSVSEKASQALITMGGSDAGGTTPKVVEAFEGLDLTVTVVVGPGFTNRDRIEAAVEETDAAFVVRENPSDLPKLMANADIAVSASGITVYELLALGTPTIAIPQADNQEPIATTLGERGVVEHLPRGSIELLHDRVKDLSEDQERRGQYRNRGRELVDCQGTDRIYRALAG